jgi:hypothetical protein
MIRTSAHGVKPGADKFRQMRNNIALGRVCAIHIDVLLSQIRQRTTMVDYF